MKCFYTIDPKTLKKVFIPMCYGTMDTLDIRDCNCPDPLTEHHFQKERYNEVLKQKNESIESMQAEIKHLNKVIINLKKNKFMNHTKAQEICKQAVELWGHEEQIKLWHEEVGELMHAISKHHRNPTPEKLDHVCEETVDVKIMTMQLEMMAPEDRIQYWFDFKINRLESRIIAEKERRAEYEDELKNFNPDKYAIFQMINEIGPNPLNGQMDDLINLILEQQEIKKDYRI